MAYTVKWHIDGRVLLLSLSGDYTVEDAEAVNNEISTELDRSGHDISLLIDACDMERPHNFQMIRNSHTFMDHPNLKYIYVVASNKLIRLTMMVIFHFARAQIQVLDDLAKADIVVQRHQRSQI